MNEIIKFAECQKLLKMFAQASEAEQRFEEGLESNPALLRDYETACACTDGIRDELKRAGLWK